MAFKNIINNYTNSNSNKIYESNYASIKPVLQQQQQQQHTQQSSISSSSSSSSSSSVQIRTSSPISSSGSELSGPVNISPSKFINAVHISRKQSCNLYKPELKTYASMKQLAFDKLRRQQAFENDLKEHFLFNNQMNPMIHTNEQIKSMGKIKLSIYNNLTHLTCHIVESRSLKLNSSSNQQQKQQQHNQATYAKISILPDLNKAFKNIKSKLTKPCLNQQNNKICYLYDSKFSFETCELNDANQRIIISVWTQSNELIGCLTFKLKHVINLDKPKYVWYHLIPFKFGLNRHIKCSIKKKSKSSSELTNVNKDLIGMEKLSLNVIKQNEHDSYGFTVTSSCPCMIGKVDLDKSAFKSGLRPGDFISRINGTNVSRASCESVVKMIKSSKLRLVIEVYRQKSIDIVYSQNYRVNVNQPQLESVPEEEEEEEYEDYEDDVLDEQDEYEYEEEEMRVGCVENYEEDNYFKVIQNSIRFVDSISSNENIEPYEQEDEAEKMRRVAAQYYSSNQLTKHANIKMLNNNQKLTNFI